MRTLGFVKDRLCGPVNRDNGWRVEKRTQASKRWGSGGVDFRNNNEWRTKGSSKDWWKSANGWHDGAGTTEYCEREAWITRGGWVHAASERNELDAVNTEMATLRKDMQVSS